MEFVLLTNFNKNQSKVYKKALSKFNKIPAYDGLLKIETKAYNKSGKLVDFCNALKQSEGTTTDAREAFWKILNEVMEEDSFKYDWEK